MAYATKAAIIEAYGEAFLTVIADRDNDGIIDDAAVTKALSRAESRMNSYFVQGGVPLPLPSVSEEVEGACIDIACYFLANRHDRLTDEIRQRFEDAMAWLKDVSKGRAGLGFDTGAEEPLATSNEASTVDSRGARRYTRDALDKIL